MPMLLEAKDGLKDAVTLELEVPCENMHMLPPESNLIDFRHDEVDDQSPIRDTFDL